MPVLSEYERRARLTPGLYAILPVAITITALGLERYKLLAALVGLLSAAGGALVLSTIVGNVGRKTQQGLLAKWGGAPTTKMLRLREPTDNPIQRQAWREAVERHSGVPLLNAGAEASDPQGADHRIAAATSQLLYLGQEGGVPAVRSENAAFGYQRNMLGFRKVGCAVAAACTVIQLIAAAWSPEQVSSASCIIGAIISAGFLALWCLLPSEGDVKEAAERYARQLLIAARNEAP